MRRYGYHQSPTTLVVAFDQALDPATAVNPRDYILTGPGGASIRVGSATYDPILHTVTLHPVGRLDLHYRYVLQVVGSSPAGVAGADGLLLDGAGRPASPYVTVVDAANLVV